jgi:DNA-binding XRE family transcriptional regulator
MSPETSTHPPPPVTPYVFQRLERVKERLYTDHLHDYLDPSRQTWYLHTTAKYLAQRLLEVYRRRVEDASNASGSDAVTPRARRALKFSTDHSGKTLVQVRVSTAEAERIAATLTKTLAADDQGDTWDNLARRLATDISTWAFERMDNDLGPTVIAAMPEATFDETLTTYAWPEDPAPLHDRVHHFLNLTAQQVAFDMMTTIDARAPALVDLEHLLGLRKTAPSTVSLQALLREEHVTVLSAAHYQAVREALAKNTFQRLDGIPWPTALLATGPARGQAQLRPVVFDTQPLMPPEEVEAWAQRMWRQRKELSDLDADALDALSALWLYQARTPQDDAVADVDELLAMRGLQAKQSGQGRRGGYMPKQRTAMLQALAHIQNLWLDMSAMEVYEELQTTTRTRRRQPTRQTIQSRAFTITDLFGQIRLDGGLDVQKFIFRPGKVFAHFLYGAGRQTALLSARALAYDPYRQTWEKRLTRYLSWQWRTRAHAGNYMQPYRVDTLLEAAGQCVNPRRLSWQRARLEKTLDTLLEDQVIAAWQYESMDAGYWPRSTVLIEPPDSIRETYQQIEQHETLRPKALSGPTTLRERLKRRRQTLGLTQLQAAEQIGISPAYLNRLEQGTRGKATSVALQKKIAGWLGTETP